MSKGSEWVSQEAEMLMVYFINRDISMTEALGIMALTLVTMWEVGEVNCTKANFDGFLKIAEESLARHKGDKV